VLTCIANLSNDEVFTPPEFANRMLDTLSEAWAADNNGGNIWADSSVRFLDPCTKSGVFLREITSRLTKGLANEIPNLGERVNHILTKQVFGIGITHLTSMLARRSVYCSKHATGDHSIAKSFTSDDGNIWFKRIEHSWADGKCAYCGASQKTLDRGEGLETHAYAFIHTDDITTRLAELFGGDMQFDVIIGNPPYQLQSDGGTRDVPIYQHFVEQAKRLQPRYLAMVIPSRWMASGLGLGEFRRTMLADTRIRELVDYPNAAEVFPSVGINGGACYFLWDSMHDGDCNITMVWGGEVVGPESRSLGEFDVLIRDGRAIPILRKVLDRGEEPINTILARDKEFGWTSNFNGFHELQRPGDVPLYYIRSMKRGKGFIARDAVTKSAHLVDKWKLLVPQVGSGRERERSGVDLVLGPPLIAPSPSVCTQSFLFFYLDSEEQVQSVKSYYATKFFRFLVSLRKITQHATHSTYSWVPMQAWNRRWTDSDLYAKYGLTDEEVAFVEATIRSMEPSDE
jgi:site-specific DNA-methyltransferase (adenine-specific)